MLKEVKTRDPFGVERRVFADVGDDTSANNGGSGMMKVKTIHTTTTLDPWSQIAIMLISAMSFIAAFAWNGTVTSFLDQRFGEDRDFRIHLVYAVIVTAVAAVAIYFIVKYTDVWIAKQQEEEDIVI